MVLADLLLKELETEAQTTRRVLERVPSDKLAWKPHEKSMSLGQLAMHVASTPGAIANSSISDSYRAEDYARDPEPTSTEQILRTHDASMAAAKSALAGLDESRAMADWSMTLDGKPVVTMPRVEWIRAFMLSHSVHHRGQLSVYLRLLNVPVPAMYGPSADENPPG